MQQLNITHYIGQDKSFSCAIRRKKKDDAGEGVQYPITGSLYFWIADSTTATAALIEKTNSDDITIHYAAGGFISIAVSAADLVAAGITEGGTYYCSLWEEDGSGKQEPLAAGTYTVTQILEDWP